MTTPTDGTGPHGPERDILDGHRARTGTEAADLQRIRALAVLPDPWDRALPLHLTGSAVVVHPPTRRVLLRRHPRLGAWMQVGGHGDPGESHPRSVALREAREETSLPDLRFWPDSCLLHAVVVSVPAGGREPAHEHADLRYVLATDRPDEASPEAPDAPLRWLALPEAQELVGQDNLRESLTRLEPLLTA
jgi:8-oxo-dGTP pyrophosphatase MutT (NUDIX family)